MFADTTRDSAPAAPYTPCATPVASGLGLAFIEACRRDTPKTAGDLHDATFNLVTCLKARGLPPERVVAEMKESLTRYSESHFPPSCLEGENALAGPESTAYRRVFAWCLDALYEPS